MASAIAMDKLASEALRPRLIIFATISAVVTEIRDV